MPSRRPWSTEKVVPLVIKYGLVIGSQAQEPPRQHESTAMRGHNRQSRTQCSAVQENQRGRRAYMLLDKPCVGCGWPEDAYKWLGTSNQIEKVVLRLQS